MTVPAIGDEFPKFCDEALVEQLQARVPVCPVWINPVTSQPGIALREPLFKNRRGNRIPCSPVNETDSACLRPMRESPFDNGVLLGPIEHLNALANVIAHM